jgi:arylsulfatase A
MAAHIDLYPTLLSLCGVERPEGPAIDGVDVTPLLEGETSSWPDRRFFTHWTSQYEPLAKFPGAVRTERYSLINGKELYDLSSDRGQQNDIAGDRPEVVEELRSAYDEWFSDVTAGNPRRLAIPVGYAEENPVILPAHQCFLSGGVKFYEGHGWAHDWVTNWRRADDSVHWELDVLVPGEYEVGLNYLCGASNLGATVRVTAGEEDVEGKIDQATSTEPLTTRDIISRNEAPVMDWGTLVLGTLTLPEGRSTLAVRATPAGGKPAMDLKAVNLRRLA